MPATKRRCGVLLHPTSLPGREGIGTLGSNAYQFIDFLSSAGMSLWQMLPLSPPACGNSPYSAFSAFAGNPLLIDLEQLVEQGDLSPSSLDDGQTGVPSRVDFAAVSAIKPSLLASAAQTFLTAGRSTQMEEFWHFCDTTPWLHDYALFTALHRRYRGRPWNRWPRDAALLTHDMHESASVALGEEIGIQKYIQWRFHQQWNDLHRYAKQCGIGLIGDLPIFVAYDSVDVWRNRHLFLLDQAGKPTAVAGVPPDYFSKTGQLWGNPLYDWAAMARDDYRWWVERFRHILNMFDTVRIDHFRGFEAAWHVPAGQRTAVRGRWVAGPGAQLFDRVQDALGRLPVIAEDLGIITPAVEELRDRYCFPGMKILQFAFGSGPDNPYLPHNHIRNSVVFTGTHDNDTTVGWAQAIGADTRDHCCRYLGSNGSNPAEDLIRIALMSVADTAILPFQDLLGLASPSRMNVPGNAFGNWEWRFEWDGVSGRLADEYAALLHRYGRFNADSKQKS